MSGLNMFLFLFLTLTGVMTVLLYRQSEQQLNDEDCRLYPVWSDASCRQTVLRQKRVEKQDVSSPVRVSAFLDVGSNTDQPESKISTDFVDCIFAQPDDCCTSTERNSTRCA